MNLLTIGSGNQKIGKSDKAGTSYRSAILSLAPHTTSGYNACPSASPGCIATCLYKSGHGYTNFVQNTRINRTVFFFKQKKDFVARLYTELTAFEKKCKKAGDLPAVRLNGMSDLIWEKIHPELFTDFAGIQFYDYTKIRSRLLKTWKLPPNYYLCFSRSETNEAECLDVLKDNKNVAVVFKARPDTWMGYPVVDGDSDDLIFLRPPGCVFALAPKGAARKDNTGFVI